MKKRVLIKLSGEALAGKSNSHDINTYDFDQVKKIADTIANASKSGYQICLVIGGGNIWRGRQANTGMNNAIADQMGMLSTMLNCLCMADALRQSGVNAIVQSAYRLETFTESFNVQNAENALEAGSVVLFALGLGHPFFTTDTAVVVRARQMQVDEILMAKNIDGIYTSDPNKDKNAKFIEELSYSDALRMNLKVMDSSAFAMLMESDIKQVRLFSLSDPNNIIKVLHGEKIGTIMKKE